MKTIHPTLQAHLDSGNTTMSYCWKLTRADGLVQGFTEHDRELVFGGVTYQASTGFTSSAVQSSLGMSVDNLNVDSALSSATINEVDLSAGRYDAAEIELWWVNWDDATNPNMRLLVAKGNIGEVKRMSTSFSAELRSLTQKTQQKTGRTYQRYCDAILGDERCKVDLIALGDPGTVANVLDSRSFSTTTISGATDRFSLGHLAFTSGENNGLKFEVRNHQRYENGIHTLELWNTLPFPIAPGDGFIVFPGCKKDRTTCSAKFANIVNFQGFEFIPGNDAVAQYPSRGAPNQDGRSLFGN